MNIYDPNRKLTKVDEMKILDKVVAEMKDTYYKTHDTYTLRMLQKIAVKQEQLSCDLKFKEV